MRSRAALFLPLSLLVAIAACSSNTTIINHVGGGDAGDEEDAGTVETDAGVVTKDAGGKKDAGVVIAQNPQPIPPVAYNGGALILSPSLVTVTFDSDPLRTTVESFDDTIGGTPWWNAVRDGFCDKNNKCIGPATGGGHVHLPTGSLQGSYTDSAGGGASTIQSMITSLINASTLPTPTANTLYMIYFPAGTNISLDGEASCSKFGGYHNSMKYNATEFAYAIMPRCATGGGAQADLDLLTNAASHELAEAATDPFISSDPQNPYTGYGSYVDAWDVPAGGEVGDRCFDILGSGNDRYQQGNYQVQRIFNNTAANAGHDPCVPAPSPSTQPYFNMAPMASAGDVIGMTAGQTVQVQVQAISDAPTSPLGWDAIDLQKGNAPITVSGSGTLSIGQKATVSVSLGAGAKKGDSAVFLVRSQQTAKGAIHYWPFLVVAQ